MMGPAFAVEGTIEPGVLADVLARAFDLAPEDVHVVDQLDERVDGLTDALVAQLTTSRPEPGAFSTWVELFSRGTVDAAIERVGHDAADRVAARSGRRCLVSDDDVNPYSWILVTPGEGRRGIWVDPVALDERDVLVPDEAAQTTMASQGPMTRAGAS